MSGHDLALVVLIAVHVFVCCDAALPALLQRGVPRQAVENALFSAVAWAETHGGAGAFVDTTTGRRSRVPDSVLPVDESKSGHGSDDEAGTMTAAQARLHKLR